MMLKECPTCGRVSDGEAHTTACAGAQYDNSAHEPIDMVALRVFREDEHQAALDSAEKMRERFRGAEAEVANLESRLRVMQADMATMFRAEDVRSLWRLVREIGGALSGKIGMAAASEADAFPAPEEWRG